MLFLIPIAIAGYNLWEKEQQRRKLEASQLLEQQQQVNLAVDTEQRQSPSDEDDEDQKQQSRSSIRSSLPSPNAIADIHDEVVRRELIAPSHSVDALLEKGSMGSSSDESDQDMGEEEREEQTIKSYYRDRSSRSHSLCCNKAMTTDSGRSVPVSRRRRSDPLSLAARDALENGSLGAVVRFLTESPSEPRRISQSLKYEVMANQGCQAMPFPKLPFR